MQLEVKINLILHATENENKVLTTLNNLSYFYFYIQILFIYKHIFCYTLSYIPIYSQVS